MTTIDPPQPAEFNEFYAGYIGKVPASGPVGLLRAQLDVFEQLRYLSEEQGFFRYAEGKWTIKQLIGHMADTERLFSYRLLHILRADSAPLAGMDENAWMAASPHGRRRIADVVDEMIVVRKATIALVESIDADGIARAGTANGFPITARALCWILPGHAQHHLGVLRERYNITAASQ
ncbi:MAG TPA: DinB family protein [Vicinamibacterales bacterium]